MRKQIGIIGATGYTGSELVRLLYHHDGVDIAAITSESRNGEAFSDVHPFFRGKVDVKLITAADALKLDLDLVFLALPHGVSMKFAEAFLQKNIPVVDLSGDFRLSSPQVYTDWYKTEHTFIEGFDIAAYGMPELNRDEIRDSKLVACPGCYPTSAILPLAPLLRKGLISDQAIIVDSKSGTTGAGVKASATTHFSNVNDNFKAYAIKTHRHSVEIEEILQSQGPDSQVMVQFTPHLLPVDRGILTTVYACPSKKITRDDVLNVMAEAYHSEPFVHMVDNPPAIKDVRGTNNCLIYADYDERTNLILLVSVIDNLVKGSSGQAIQNMNLLLGFEESTSLNIIPLNP